MAHQQTLLEIDDGPALIDPPPRSGRRTSTRTAYDYDYGAYARFAREQHAVAFPATPSMLAAYFGKLGREKRPTTIQRAFYAIRAKHTTEGYASPTEHPLVAAALKEAIREAKKRLPGPVSDDALPALPQLDLESAHLHRILAAMDERLHGLRQPRTDGGSPAITPGDELRDLRDRALLLLLFCGALKRDEARTLEVGNIVPIPEGFSLKVNASPDNPDAARPVSVLVGDDERTCPIGALIAYLQAAGIAGGPVFRRIFDSGEFGEEPLSQSRMSRLWNARCLAAGLNPARVSPRSLRTGFAREAARNGATLESILRQTGHRNPEHLLRILRRANLYPDHAQRFTGL